MKVGREPERDPERLDAARSAVNDDVELFVDANGAFTAKTALAWAERFALGWGVSWFEEPVSSADFAGCGSYTSRGRQGSRSPRASTPTWPATSATSSAASTFCRPT
ncbi:MAG TPA: enolase C-terminal domain-like protein [Gaiellaceae bacterium]|jgi:L-alanine-DL-glutamate epimerase-like enolase superfamily enzyme